MCTTNNFLAKFKGILFFHLDGSSLNSLPLMLHDRVYWLLISKSSQLLSEPLFLFRKLLFYGGSLWLGASFLIILRIARSEGDSQNYWYKQKCKRMKCYSPPQSSGQIACVIFNLRGFQMESFSSAHGTLGLPNTLLFAMPEELESSPRLLNGITSKSEKWLWFPEILSTLSPDANNI